MQYSCKTCNKSALPVYVGFILASNLFCPFSLARIVEVLKLLFYFHFVFCIPCFIWRLTLLNFNGDCVWPVGLGQVHVSRDTSNIIIINNNNNNMNINTILNLTLNNYDGDCGSVWLMSWTRVVAGRAQTNLKFKKLKLKFRPT